MAVLILLFGNLVDQHGPQLVGMGYPVWIVPSDFASWDEDHLHLADYSDEGLAVQVVGDKDREGACLGYPLFVASEDVVEVFVRVYEEAFK